MQERRGQPRSLSSWMRRARARRSRQPRARAPSKPRARDPESANEGILNLAVISKTSRTERGVLSRPDPATLIKRRFQMRRLFTTGLWVLILCSPITSLAQDRSTRAKELIGQAREALGGDARLAAVQSLSMTASFKRALGEEMQADGEFELNILLPDKFKRVETMKLPLGGASVTRIEGLNGEQRFSDSRTNSSGGGAILFRRAEDSPDGQANALRATRADFARNLLVLLLTSSQTLPLELAYVGEAKSEDGTAVVIEAKASDGFSA